MATWKCQGTRQSHSKNTHLSVLTVLFARSLWVGVLSSLLIFSIPAGAQSSCAQIFSTSADVSQQILRKQRPGRRAVVAGEDAQTIETRQKMNSLVIGQPQLIDAAIRILSRARLGIKRRGVSGAVLVYGPTGVGKTKAFESLAEAVDGKIIKLEGGNFMTEASVTSLTGASPTYIGHGETTPIITQKLIDESRGKKIPVTIILINELDKAHQAFLDWWLKGLDDGQNEIWVPRPGSDKSKGAESVMVNLRNVIVVATANSGADVVVRQSENIKRDFETADPDGLANAEGIGALAVQRPVDVIFQAAANQALIDSFKRPEFLGRWDEIVPAYPLLEKGYKRILRLELSRLEMQYANATNGKRIKIRMTERAQSWLFNRLEPQYGARNLSKLVDKYIDTSIINALGSEEIASGDKIAIDVAEDESGLRFFARPALKLETTGTNRQPKPNELSQEIDEATRAKISEILSLPDDARLKALYSFVKTTGPSLTVHDALILLSHTPKGLNLGWDGLKAYGPQEAMKSLNLGRWSPGKKEYADFAVVVRTLNSLKRSITESDAKKLIKVSREILDKSLGTQDKNPEYLADIYSLIEILAYRAMTNKLPLTQ